MIRKNVRQFSGSIMLERAERDDDRDLVQDVVGTLGKALIGSRGIELGELRLEMLIDQEQRAHRATQVTAAARDDLVDRRVV
jgi:hypothetical protein